MFKKKRKDFGPGRIGVKPKNFRFLILHIIENYENVAVWVNDTLIDNYSETGLITQQGLSQITKFLIKIDKDEVLGFQYFPDQMWISLKYKDIAIDCQEQDWLKIDKHSRSLLEKSCL